MRTSTIIASITAVVFATCMLIIGLIIFLNVSETTETSPHGFDELNHYSTDATGFCTCANPVQ